MDNVAQISCIRSPAFGTLLVRKDFDERKVIYRCRMPAHFKPRVEQVIFLIRLVRSFPDLLEFQIVSSLLADLRNRDDAELETSRKRIMLHNFFPEAQNIKIKDMRMTAF